jgi:hypothetical protein
MTTELQQKTYDLWADLQDLKGCYYDYADPADAVFQSEVQTYGPIEAAATWQLAYSALKAKFLADAACEDGQYLIEFHLYHAPKREGWLDLVPDVVTQLLMIPTAQTALERGWQKIKGNGCEYGADIADLEGIRRLIDAKSRNHPAEQQLTGARTSEGGHAAA